MSMATLERAIVAGAQTVFNNRSLRKKDLQEWNSAEIKPKDETEVTAYISDPGVWVTVLKVKDKRTAIGGGK